MLLIWVGLSINFVAAADVAQDLAAARASLVADDFDSAKQQLRQVFDDVPASETVLDAKTVSEVLYLQAMLPRLMGASRAQDDERLREALVIFPELKWDRELLDDPGQRGFFEALRDEVGQREVVATQVPEAMGRARAFVDGVQHGHGKGVRKGQHLAQVKCPGGAVRGTWTEFEDDPKWLSMCPEPVDTSLPAVVLAEGSEDFGFGMDENVAIGPEPLDYVAKAKTPVSRPPPSPIDKQTLLIASGGAFVVSAAVYVLALTSRAAYDDLDSHEFSTPADLAKQRKRTNAQVGVSTGFAVAGIGIGAYATFRGTW